MLFELTDELMQLFDENSIEHYCSKKYPLLESFWSDPEKRPDPDPTLYVLYVMHVNIIFP